MSTIGRLGRYWLNPWFYMNNLKRKMFGEDLSFLQRDRQDFSAGSFEWLVLSEILYGGIQRAKMNVLDPAVQGGDRMTPIYHNYGRCYAEFLSPFVAEKKPQNLLEIGILNGTGLAIWCDLFPSSRVIGFDLHLENFQSNLPDLQARGAFSQANPEVYQFDQLDQTFSSGVLSVVLGNTSLDVVVDDGAHTTESIISTFQMVRKYLSSDFVYFIEDNYDAIMPLRKQFPGYRWLHRGQLTICRPVLSAK